MKALTIEIKSDEAFWRDAARRFRAAAEGQPQGSFYSFPSVEEFQKTLTPNRWSLLRALLAKPPVGLRALARRVGRDVKGVHSDVHALLECGLLERTGAGQITFARHERFDVIHVDFTVHGTGAEEEAA